MSAEAGAIAERLGQAGAPALCLTPSAASTAQIKQCFGGCQRLVRVLPLAQLLAAAARLPVDENIVAAAAVLEAGEDGGGSQRWRIYEELRQHCGEGYSAAARFQLAKKLAGLFAEVDEQLPLAAGQSPFATAVEDERSHETAVAAAVWELLGEEVLAKQPLMRQLAAQLPPFLAVCDDDTTPVQMAFYQQCNAERVYLPPAPAAAVWRQAFMPAGEAPARCSHAAMEGVGENLAAAAQLALVALRRLLAAAPAEEKIGVMVYDRLLARRLRALAEANGILITDKSGWRADSLSYGAALVQAAALLLDEFSLAAVAAVLQPPFYADEECSAAAQQWRELFAEALSLPADEEALRQRCGAGTALAQRLEAVQNARAQAAAARQTLAGWLQWLNTAADALLAAWRQDGVAQTLRVRLVRRAAAAEAEMSGGEFLLWLRDALTSEHISDGEVESRVEFVPPGSQRRFAALLLLGCTGKAAGDDEGWLGERERQGLQLPLRADRVERQRRRFSQLLAAHAQVAAVWCAVDAAGKPNAPNPFWQLFAAHCRQHGKWQQVVCAPESCVAGGVSPPPAAAAVVRQPLRRLALSAADSLMKCPYLFYSKSVLGLSECDEVEMDGVNPRLAGILLHRALAAFSQGSGALDSPEALMTCWQGVLGKTLRGNRPGLGLLLEHWRASSGAFIDWEWKRRQAGWRTQAVEYRLKGELALAGGVLALSGRIDRLDVNDEGQTAVIDYKSGALASKKVLGAGELPQLPLYAFFADVQPAAEQLLSSPLGREARQVVSPASGRRVAARLRRVLRQIDAGTPLPANGALSSACPSCPAAGVCRREHWQA